jgi:hypothetical protein
MSSRRSRPSNLPAQAPITLRLRAIGERCRPVPTEIISRSSGDSVQLRL